MSLPRRARSIRAEREDVPAFDAFRLVQPKAYSDVSLNASQLYGSKSATVRQRVFVSFRCVAESMGVAKNVRD